MRIVRLSVGELILLNSLGMDRNRSLSNWKFMFNLSRHNRWLCRLSWCNRKYLSHSWRWQRCNKRLKTSSKGSSSRFMRRISRCGRTLPDKLRQLMKGLRWSSLWPCRTLKKQLTANFSQNSRLWRLWSSNYNHRSPKRRLDLKKELIPASLKQC